jgi:hypothetical protein
MQLYSIGFSLDFCFNTCMTTWFTTFSSGFIALKSFKAEHQSWKEEEILQGYSPFCWTLLSLPIQHRRVLLSQGFMSKPTSISRGRASTAHLSGNPIIRLRA